MLAHFVLQARQFGQQGQVQRLRAGGGGLAAKAQAYLDFAARDGGHDGGAQVRLQRPQIVVDAELQVEKARVDALDFNCQCACSTFAGGNRVACHA